MAIFELDGLRLKVTVSGGTADDPLPVSFGWASAIASRVAASTAQVVGTAAPSGRDILCTWAADALSSGVWMIQVRAGETEATARTVYSEPVTIHDSLRVA